jgi:hypothetical protein
MPGRRNVNQGVASTNEAKTPKAKKEVTTGSTEIAAANGYRTALIISSGAKDVWISLGAAAVVGEGIFLSKENKSPLLLEGWSGTVFAIGAEATTISWAEF